MQIKWFSEYSYINFYHMNNCNDEAVVRMNQIVASEL